MITLGSIASAIGRAFAIRDAKAAAARERVHAATETKRQKAEADEERWLKEMTAMIVRQTKRR